MEARGDGDPAGRDLQEFPGGEAWSEGSAVPFGPALPPRRPAPNERVRILLAPARRRQREITRAMYEEVLAAMQPHLEVIEASLVFVQKKSGKVVLERSEVGKSCHRFSATSFVRDAHVSEVSST